MARITGYSDTIVGFRRLQNKPLEYNSVFDNKESANEYVANDPTAYEGQVISVKNDGIYMIIRDSNLGNLKLIIVSLIGGNEYYEIDDVTDSITIHHEMNRYPTVKVLDTDLNIVYMDINYNDLNNLTLTWNGSFSGRVYLT